MSEFSQKAEAVTHSVLVAVNEPHVGLGVSSSIRALGRLVVGPFRSNADALDRLDAERVDGAILDTLLEDGSAFQLAAALHRGGIPFVFVADFDARRKTIRAEFPDSSGVCQEAPLLDLLSALKGAGSH
jgi:DNA-binding NarL/FixJ family response regulator